MFETEKEKHLSFRRRPFDASIVKNIFNSEELNFLSQYGTWMEALYLGDLTPLNEEQKDFIACMDKVEPPENESFRIFWKFLKRRELLKTQKLNNNKQLIKDDREDWKKIRRSRY